MCFPPNSVDDDVIVQHFVRDVGDRGGRGTERDQARIAEALNMVHAKYRHEIADRLRARFPRIQSHEIAEIWNETLEHLAERALAGVFKAEGCLSALVRTIAFRRTIDLRRRQRRRQRQRQLDEVVHGDALLVKDEDFQLAELLTAIREAIGELPERQRQVWEAFRDLEFKRRKAALLAAASQRAGKPLTWKAVCRALQEGRKKVIKKLRRQGYAW